MPVVEINWLALLLSGVASMVVGFLWYSPMMFARPWMALMGLTEKKMAEAKKSMQKTYMISFVMSLVMAYVLVHSMTFAGAFFGLTGVQVGLMAGFWSWLGFVMPVQMTDWLFGGKPFQLFLINTGYQLASLLAMGIVLAMWM